MSGTSATSIRRCTPGRRSSPTVWSRSGMARAISTGWSELPEAVAQFHLVGEPQGPGGEERLRRRLPGPRQHRRLRPQRAAADRRLPRAGRRHRLDGALLPEHAGDRRRAGDGEAGLRGHVPSSSSSISCGSPGPDACRRRDRDVGRGGWVLLRRAPAARWPRRAAEGALHGGPASALCGHRLRREAPREASRSCSSASPGSSRRARS